MAGIPDGNPGKLIGMLKKRQGQLQLSQSLMKVLEKVQWVL
jgi:hypothetical protein